MVKILANTAHGITVESNLESIEAAQRRLKMLSKRFPFTEHWIEHNKPAVTVTRIKANDPYATHIRRNA